MRAAGEMIFWIFSDMKNKVSVVFVCMGNMESISFKANSSKGFKRVRR